MLNNCILWGSRVVIPFKLRKTVLTELHVGHPGVTRMKSLARMFVWWPGMETEIEHLVATCTPCQLQQSKPPVAPLNPWSWPTRPWTRLHLDFAGPVQGKMFLILIDSHSKWIEVMITTGSTSAIVTQALKTWFAQFGLPEMVVTDNGPGFASEEFEVFLQNNGIKHMSAPYHP